jgi:hypothetical protein
MWLLLYALTTERREGQDVENKTPVLDGRRYVHGSEVVLLTYVYGMSTPPESRACTFN